MREAVRLAGPRPLWARILLAAECSSSPAPPSCRREEAGRPTVDNGPGGSGETGSGARLMTSSGLPGTVLRGRWDIESLLGAALRKLA